MQSKGNVAKDILIDYKADTEQGCPVKTDVNARWFYVIVLHSQKYKNIISYYCYVYPCLSHTVRDKLLLTCMVAPVDLSMQHAKSEGQKCCSRR